MLALVRDGSLRVRAARPDDLPRLAVIRRESWWAAYHRILAHDWLRAMNDRRAAQRMAAGLGSSRHRILVAETEVDGVLGYAWVGQRHAHRDDHGGELLVLYLHPSAWGHGHGRRLLVAGIWWLVEHDLHPVLVWVLAANHPARRFYEACGGEPVGQGPITIGAQELLRVAYGWRDALPLPL